MMTKRKSGRPKIQVDFDQVDKLCAIHCTGEEIASVMGVDYDTLSARIKENFGINTSEYIKKKSMAGKASLRRMQFRSAENGSIPMQIWLGKQYLDQTEQAQTTLDLSESLRELAENLPD